MSGLPALSESCAVQCAKASDNKQLNATAKPQDLVSRDKCTLHVGTMKLCCDIYILRSDQCVHATGLLKHAMRQLEIMKL